MGTAMTGSKAMTKTQNFAQAVKVAASQISAGRLVELSAVKAHGFPYTTKDVWAQEVRKATTAGYLRIMCDGAKVWVVVR
jgi:hypothetical protein